jgi:hypothetical protein
VTVVRLKYGICSIAMTSSAQSAHVQVPSAIQSVSVRYWISLLVVVVCESVIRSLVVCAPSVLSDTHWR